MDNLQAFTLMIFIISIFLALVGIVIGHKSEWLKIGENISVTGFFILILLTVFGLGSVAQRKVDIKSDKPILITHNKTIVKTVNGVSDTLYILER